MRATVLGAAGRRAVVETFSESGVVLRVQDANRATLAECVIEGREARELAGALDAAAEGVEGESVICGHAPAVVRVWEDAARVALAIRERGDGQRGDGERVRLEPSCAAVLAQAVRRAVGAAEVMA